MLFKLITFYVLSLKTSRQMFTHPQNLGVYQFPNPTSSNCNIFIETFDKDSYRVFALTLGL